MIIVILIFYYLAHLLKYSNNTPTRSGLQGSQSNEQYIDDRNPGIATKSIKPSIMISNSSGVYPIEISAGWELVPFELDKYVTSF